MQSCNYGNRKKIPWPERGTEAYKLRLHDELTSQCDMANRRKANANPICPICNDRKTWFEVVPDQVLYYKTIARICGCSQYQMPEYSNLSDYQTLEEWQKAVKENARMYIESSVKGAWFFIGGQVGAGKSFISAVIGRAYSQKGIGVKFMKWNEVSRQLKSKAFDSTFDSFCLPFKTAAVLIIDDFFLGKPTEADIRVAREILDYRYDNYLKTVVNSEKTLREIRDVDEGAASRIADRAGNYLCNIGRNPSRDWRRKQEK